jgi:tetratricopeptide (TPR) repeat protein/predicted Ser/Thr protein kinase
MNGADTAPTHVGPFRVVRLLAQGGMSVVYEVADPDDGRSLAAKVLMERGQGVPRFGREYRALTRLDHPNIVRVFRYGMTEEGQPYLVMELLHGVPAQVRVKSLGRPGEPIRTGEAARITMRVAKALEYMHARGIVHRDLKSSNVIVLGDGQVKVLDFGTARLLHTPEALTDPGEFVGTFHYASPEQLTGKEVGPRSDLYALGVLLYRMLTGRRPYESDHPPTLARMHLEVVPLPPRRVVPALPEALSALTMKMLAKRPGDRPENAARVVEALRAHLPTTDTAVAPVLPLLRNIGRASQLRAIHQLLDEPEPGAALLFTGAEGSGRSRLVRLALEEAQVRTFRTFEVPFGSHARPLVALAEQVVATFADVGEHAAVRAAQAVATGALAPDPTVIARMLAARADADPLPIVLGARAMEDGTRAEVECLLSALAILHGEGATVMAFASWAERPVPRVWPGARAVPVPPLTATEVAVLVSQWLGVASVSPELVRRLLTASGGMPGPLEQLVRALPHGREQREAPFSVPASVRDALLVRLESLARLHRRAAEAVALTEGDLELAQLAHAIDETEEDTRAALDALVADQLLVEQEGRWSFRVGMAGALVRERLRPTRRHVLCRRIADTVEGATPSPRLAAVLLDAGLVEAAGATAVAWATPLVRAGLYAEAVPLLERIAAARGNASADSPLWRLYAECLAEVRPEGGAADQAIGRARALAAHVGDLGDTDLMAARLARGRGDTNEEREMLVRAVERLGRMGDPTRAGVAAERLAELELLAGALDSGYKQALVAVQSLRGPDARRAAVVLATAQIWRGELRAAEAVLAEVLAAPDLDTLSAWRAVTALASALRPQGRFSEARARIEAALPVARIQAPAPLFAGLLLAAAEVDVDLFRVGQARERLAQALDAVPGGAPAALDAAAAVLGARLAGLAGDVPGALRVLEPALERASSRQFLGVAARLRAARGLQLLRAGRTTAGNADLDAARDVLRAAGALPALAEIAVGRAEIADGTNDPIELFADVAAWMEMQPVRVVRLEFLLAAMRHAERLEDTPRAEAFRHEAEAVFGQIRKMLAAEDDTSLGVHPWRQILRWG